ncbi:hypothetical protein J2Z21_000020 [Streptomyces griseochromogenes]|uniref:Uncharacterized protein n=1 Tax=Streptomyces griseochromogenes TaxID=68214 RepID=A0A1B1B141_9ACTN|nr:hypothetical protein [Streptomyces griseochromogenes]ANP52537.1 hypothetical protein AVL59_26025 [Streptomyces griseochromogenes]MBP2047098.1 hypothetical protein [Streptomyces griseochromogenes]
MVRPVRRLQGGTEQRPRGGRVRAVPQCGEGPVAAAVALRAVLPWTTALTDLQRGLPGEWLDRIEARPN